MEASRKLIDWPGFRMRVADDDFIVSDLCASFIAELPALVDAIGRALVQNNPQALEFAAHRVKSTIAMLGADSVVECVQTLEDMGREGRLAGAEFLWDKLQIFLTSIMSEMKSFLDEQSQQR